MRRADRRKALEPTESWPTEPAAPKKTPRRDTALPRRSSTSPWGTGSVESGPACACTSQRNGAPAAPAGPVELLGDRREPRRSSCRSATDACSSLRSPLPRAAYLMASTRRRAADRLAHPALRRCPSLTSAFSQRPTGARLRDQRLDDASRPVRVDVERLVASLRPRARPGLFDEKTRVEINTKVGRPTGRRSASSPIWATRPLVRASTSRISSRLASAPRASSGSA